MNPELSAAEQKLALLAVELKDKPEFARVKLWIARACGRPAMSDYLRDESLNLKERAGTVERLNEILLAKDYARLPDLAAAPAEGDAEAEEPPMSEVDIRRIVRQELAAVLETIARVLKE